MKILHQDRDEGVIKIRVQSTDDCWHLYNLLEEGDRAASFTHRTSQQPQDKTRAGKGEKEGMYLTLEVADVGFQRFSDRLRIQGVIVEGPQDLGKHHTFNVTPGTVLTIQKEWGPSHLKRLKKAVEASAQPSIVVLAMDEEEATIALLHQYGVEEKAHIVSGRSGKQYESDSTEHEYYGDIYAKLQQYDLPLVIVGPGFAKETFLSFAQNRGDLGRYVVETIGHAGMAGVKEAMNRGIVERIVEASTLARESRQVEELLQAIAKDEAVTYGEDEVARAIELGAAERVLVVSNILHEKETLLEKAEKMGAEVHAVSDIHESGEKLAALGGIAAFLRYRIS